MKLFHLQVLTVSYAHGHPRFSKPIYLFSTSPFIQVSGLCEKFIETIDDRLQSEDISWERNPEDGNGVAIAFAVHSSRLKADIERDLRKGAWIIII